MGHRAQDQVLAEWSAIATYAAGVSVLRNGVPFVCQTSNSGNDPTTDVGTNWKTLLEVDIDGDTIVIPASQLNESTSLDNVNTWLKISGTLFSSIDFSGSYTSATGIYDFTGTIAMSALPSGGSVTIAQDKYYFGINGADGTPETFILNSSLSSVGTFGVYTVFEIDVSTGAAYTGQTLLRTNNGSNDIVLFPNNPLDPKTISTDPARTAPVPGAGDAGKREVVNTAESGYALEKVPEGILLATNSSVQTAGDQSDRVVKCDTSSSILTVTVDSSDIAKLGFMLFINDEGGNATTLNITIATEGSENIDGSSTKVISTDSASVILYSDGSNLFSISGLV